MIKIKYSPRGCQDWKECLFSALNEGLFNDSYWSDIFTNSMCEGKFNTHLGIFVEPYLQYIIEGQKTLESRFSKNRTSPYKQVEKDDIILLKKSGGPIVGVCRVKEAWSYELDNQLWEEIKEVHANALCISNPQFWEKKKHSNYATLMKISNVCVLDPVIQFDKSDRRGWIVIDSKKALLNLNI